MLFFYYLSHISEKILKNALNNLKTFTFLEVNKLIQFPQGFSNFNIKGHQI